MNENITEGLVIPQFIPGDRSCLASCTAAAKLFRGGLIILMEARLFK